MRKRYFEKFVNAPSVYLFFMKIRPFTGKYIFLVICVVGLMWYAAYTDYIIGKLKKNATTVTQTYAELMGSALSDKMNSGRMQEIFIKTVKESDIPVIITDTSWHPITWRNVSTGFFSKRSIIPDTQGESDLSIVKTRVEELRREYPPKTLWVGQTGKKAGYLVYGNIGLIKDLSWMPLIEIFLISAFMLFLYFALHNIRVTERGNLWVGLAKETAHQIGTPISSLMGWVEYMRSVQDAQEHVEPEVLVGQIDGICENMESDLQRLRKITNRFSHIGSTPVLTKTDINRIVEDTAAYFKKRLPVLGKRITILTDYGKIPEVSANRELLEWVLENLFKNSFDALKRPDGLIEISTEYIDCDQCVRVMHKDNGTGMSWEDHKKIFSPGYTTKKRGWGLGLTLTKRIVEDYHNGRIYVSWSQKSKGTVFCLDLPVDGAKSAHT